jgi:hypothetical protein
MQKCLKTKPKKNRFLDLHFQREIKKKKNPKQKKTTILQSKTPDPLGKKQIQISSNSPSFFLASSRVFLYVKTAAMMMMMMRGDRAVKKRAEPSLDFFGHCTCKSRTRRHRKSRSRTTLRRWPARRHGSSRAPSCPTCTRQRRRPGTAQGGGT